MMMNNKLSVLFVDDDINVINGIKRILYKYRDQWKMYFVSSGERAIEILALKDIDVLVCDIMMPGLNGYEVLQYTYEEHPHVIRFILSGYHDEELILKSTKYAHQYLQKPISPAFIINTIKKTVFTRGYLDNDPDIIKKISSIRVIPGIPELYIKINTMLSDENTSTLKIADTIAEEPSLVAKILHVVNSGFFGISQRITSIETAISYLGINLLKALILYYLTFENKWNYTDVTKQIERIGRESMNTAKLAQIIAEVSESTKEESEEVFIAALMHRIGEIVIIENPEVFSIHSTSVINPPGIAAYILGMWGLPSVVVEAIAYQNDPLNENNTALKHTLNLFLSRKLLNLPTEILEGFGKIAESNDSERIESYALKYFGIDNAEFSKISEYFQVDKVIGNYLKN